MSIKYRKGTGGSRRMSVINRTELSRNRVKGLTFSQKLKAGRNQTGQIVCRGRGGGAARRLRHLQSQPANGPHRILRFEHDPTRTAWLALMADEFGNLHYRVAPAYTSQGQFMDNWDEPDEAVDRVPRRYPTPRTVRRYRYDGKVTMPMKHIPSGMVVHNVEAQPGQGPEYCRSAGTRARLYRTERPGYVHLRLPSGEERFLSNECRATYGLASVVEHKQTVIGKAGRRRLKGRRPKVRGVAMNPVDHPHGGGEGRSSGGRHSVTPKGIRTHWNPTRSLKKSKKDTLLIKPRPRKGSVHNPK